MIEFVCPGCTKALEANRAFAGFESRCLRCGTLLRVPARSGAAVSVLDGPPPPRPARRPAPPPPDTDLDDSARAEDTATEPTPAPVRKRVRAVAADTPAPPVVETLAVPDPEQVAFVAAAKRKRLLWIVGGAVAASVAVVAAVVYFTSGTPKPKDVPAPPATPQKEPEPQPPSPPPPKKAALPVAPMPRAVRPSAEYTLTAAALQMEYAEAPAACDAQYVGKGVIVRGVFHQYRLGKLTLAAAPDSPAPLAVTLVVPAEVEPGAPLLPDPGLTPGQPVTVRAVYQPGCRLVEADVVTTAAPADAAYAGRSVVLEGCTVQSVSAATGTVPFPTLRLEPPATDSKVTVTCTFKVSDHDQLMRLKPGTRVDVRGWCAGRSYTAVRLDNCAVLSPDDAAEGLKVAADRFHLDYEADLLAAPRPDPTAEALPVTAEGLASSFQLDLRTANAAYRFRPVQLSGTVVQRLADTRTLVLEAGTDTRYRVAVVFGPAAYAAVPPTDKTVVVRGVCSGLWNNSFVRVDSAACQEADPGAARTDLAFLPYRPGREYVLEHLTPLRGKANPIVQVGIRFAGDDLLHVTQQRTGTFPGASLFGESPPAPKWNPPPKGRLPHQTRQYRVRDDRVEIGQVMPTADSKDLQTYWEPVLKAGLKAGQSWGGTFPDGRLATYTVVGFGTDAAGRATVEVKRTVRNPLDPARWEESAVVYAKGVGEVRRVVTTRSAAGEAVVTGETRLVSDGSPAELKGKE